MHVYERAPNGPLDSVYSEYGDYETLVDEALSAVSARNSGEHAVAMYLTEKEAIILRKLVGALSVVETKRLVDASIFRPFIHPTTAEVDDFLDTAFHGLTKTLGEISDAG